MSARNPKVWSWDSKQRYMYYVHNYLHLILLPFSFRENFYYYFN